MHAVMMWDELDALRRRVDDLLLTARVVLVMLSLHGAAELAQLW
jgi:hypothetical protein